MTAIGEQFNQLVEAALTAEQSQPNPDGNLMVVEVQQKPKISFKNIAR